MSTPVPGSAGSTKGHWSRVSERLSRIAGPALLFATGLGMCAWTWGTWPDVVVDFGRELYVPWQLSEGRVLFTEIAWFNGPLSPYFNALLFLLFGVGLRTLVVANLVLLALATALLFRLLERMAGRFAATAACLVFLLLFAFGQFMPIGNYNWVTPYSHEAIHGVLLALGSLAALEHWGGGRSARWVVLAGLLVGLAFLTKAEVFLAAALASGLAFVLTSASVELARERLAGNLVVFLGSMLAPIALAFVLLALAVPADQAWRGTLGSWPAVLRGDVAALKFYQTGMGLDAPLGRLAEMARWIGGYALVLVPAAALALAAPGRSWVGRALACAALAAVGYALWTQRADIQWLRAARPFPLFALIAAGIASVQHLRAHTSEEVFERTRGALPFAVFALALLFKMLLHARVPHYGFVLAMPATMLVVVALVAWIPQAIDSRGRCGLVFRAAALALLAVATVEHLRVQAGFVQRKRIVVGEGADAFRADLRGSFVNEAVRLLRLQPEASTLAVVPEGVMLNYLARRVNPTPFVTFMPPEIVLFGEPQILSTFQAHPPDCIALVHKDTSQYGFPFFGRDYGRELATWIQGHYDPVRDLGEPPLMPGTAFGIRLLQRKK